MKNEYKMKKYLVMQLGQMNEIEENFNNDLIKKKSQQQQDLQTSIIEKETKIPIVSQKKITKTIVQINEKQTKQLKSLLKVNLSDLSKVIKDLIEKKAQYNHVVANNDIISEAYSRIYQNGNSLKQEKNTRARAYEVLRVFSALDFLTIKRTFLTINKEKLQKGKKNHPKEKTKRLKQKELKTLKEKCEYLSKMKSQLIQFHQKMRIFKYRNHLKEKQIIEQKQQKFNLPIILFIVNNQKNKSQQQIVIEMQSQKISIKGTKKGQIKTLTDFEIISLIT